MQNRKIKSQGFSLIELSIVMLIIAIIFAVVIGGQKLVKLTSLTKARSLTNSSSVNGIDGLVLWLETTSKNSFLDAERVDGAFVSNWQDINPQRNFKANATQTGATSIRPNYIENGINGLPALDFDNAYDDYLEIPYSAKELGLTSGNHEAFVVFSAQDKAAVDEHYSVLSFGDGQYYVAAWFNSNTAPASRVSYGAEVVAADGISKSSIPSSKPNYLINGRIENGNGYRTVNDSAESVTIPQANLNTPTNVHMLIGQWSFGTPGVYFFYGKIGEIILFNRALSVTERNDVKTYLSKKWGIKI